MIDGTQGYGKAFDDDDFCVGARAFRPRLQLWRPTQKQEAILDPYEAALRILKLRIDRSGYGWANNEELHALLDNGDIFTAAMCQAAHESLWTAAKSGMDEETITASFMGGLTSCLTWFALMARMGGSKNDVPRHCDIYWAHQSRQVEGWRGADFGLARRVSKDSLRISLYQAKVVPQGGKADLLRRPRYKNRAAADRNLHALLTKAPSKILPANELHQIHKFYQTRSNGLREAGYDLKSSSLPEWVRYVFWFASKDGDQPLSPPLVRSVPSLLNEMRRNRPKPRDARFHAGDFLVNPSTIENTNKISQDFIAQASNFENNDLIVSPKMARRLMGELAKIGIPDFLSADEVGGEEGQEFWEDVYGLTNLKVVFKTGTRDIGDRLTKVPSSLKTGLSRGA